MSGLKDNFPGVAQGGNRGWKVTPDEIDMDMQYVIINPSTANDYFGAGTVTAGASGTTTGVNVIADHPRNLLLTVTGVAGGIGGTLVANYIDNFGGTVQETIGLATAASAGTKAGTGVVFKYLGGTFTAAGLGGTAIATVKVGVGTKEFGDNLAVIFGLPAKIRGTTDIKSINYVTGGTMAQGDQTAVALAANGVYVGAPLVSTTSIIVRYRSSYNSSGKAQISNI